MERAPQSIEAETAEAASRKLAGLARAEAERLLRGFKRFVPPLEPEDALGLTIVHLLDWWMGCHDRGRPFSNETLNHCSTLSLRHGVEADIEFSRLVMGGDCEVGTIGEWWMSWNERLDGICSSSTRRNPRSELLQRLAMPQRSLTQAPQRVLTQVRRGLRKWNEEWGYHPSPGEEGAASLAATFIEVTDRKDIRDLLHVDESGAFGIGWQKVRDALGPRGRDKPAAASMDHDPAGNAPDPLATAMKADSVRQLRDLRSAVLAVAAARAKRHKPGSAKRAVLESFGELTSGNLGVTELARRKGLSQSSVSEAFELETEALRKDPSLSRLAEGL